VADCPFDKGTCLARVVRAAGVPRASSVPCAFCVARRALRPRQALRALTVAVASVLGSGNPTPSPLAFVPLEAPSLQQEANPAYGSRLPGSTLLGGRSVRGPEPRCLSFHRATLGFGRLVRPYHSVLSFRTLTASPPGLGDFHPRLRTASPSAPDFGFSSECPVQCEDPDSDAASDANLIPISESASCSSCSSCLQSVLARFTRGSFGQDDRIYRMFSELGNRPAEMDRRPTRPRLPPGVDVAPSRRQAAVSPPLHAPPDRSHFLREWSNKV
jgi:hypothetical protein